MRWLAAGTVVCLIVAGCSARLASPPSDPPAATPVTMSSDASATAIPVAFARLTGTVSERGPEYQDQSGSCARIPHSIELRGGDLWYVTTGNPFHADDDLVVWDEVRIAFLHGPSGCDHDGVLLGFRGHGDVTVQIKDQGETKRAAASGGGITWDGQPLAAGQSLLWAFHEVVQGSPMGGQGTYTYDGNLTVDFVGLLASGELHPVGSCDALPGGC